jgi:hypothetical protein
MCEEETKEERVKREKEKRPPLPCIREMDGSFVSRARDGRYYTCIYSTKGIIGHYFVLLRQDGKWYISSSYGSEWVRIPVRTQEIPVEDLQDMLDAFQAPGEEENRQLLDTLFRRYFLEGGLRMLYSPSEYEANASLKGKVIPPALGIQKELNTVLSSSDALRIGFIEHMEENISEIVRGMIPEKVMGGLSLLTRSSKRSSRTKRRRGGRGGRRTRRRRF